MADLTVDNDGKPLIGTPLGRLEIVLNGVLAMKEFKMEKLVGWHDGEIKTMPILEYPDGTREVLFSMSQTNWKF